MLYLSLVKEIIHRKIKEFVMTGLRQLPLHKTSCKIAGSRLNSGFFIAKTCQFFEKYLLYVLCGVVLYGIILV